MDLCLLGNVIKDQDTTNQIDMIIQVVFLLLSSLYLLYIVRRLTLAKTFSHVQLLQLLIMAALLAFIISLVMSLIIYYQLPNRFQKDAWIINAIKQNIISQHLYAALINLSLIMAACFWLQVVITMYQHCEDFNLKLHRAGKNFLLALAISLTVIYIVLTVEQYIKPSTVTENIIRYLILTNTLIAGVSTLLSFLYMIHKAKQLMAFDGKQECKFLMDCIFLFISCLTRFCIHFFPILDLTVFENDSFKNIDCKNKNIGFEIYLIVCYSMIVMLPSFRLLMLFRQSKEGPDDNLRNYLRQDQLQSDF